MATDRHTHPFSGFTLIELIVVLSIVSIIVAIAVPSIQSILASNRVVINANEMVAALNLAKAEAIRTGRQTVLCKSSNGKECTNEGKWRDGWLLTDIVDNRIIRTHGAFDKNLGVNFRTGDAIKFRPNGSSNINGRFCFKNDYDEANSRAVIIFRGRIRSEKRNAKDDCAAA